MPKKGRRHNLTGRSKRDGRYVQLFYSLLETEAARQLSGTAFKLLVYLAKRYNGSNNGKIAFGSRSGCFIPDKKSTDKRSLIDVPIGLRPRTVSDALFELERAGFIVCMTPSSFDQKRLVREWRLTWLRHNDEAPSMDFLKVVGPFKRKKQNAGRAGTLSIASESAVAPYEPLADQENTPSRASGRPKTLRDRAPERPHLDTIGSGSDVLSAARALMERRARAASLAHPSAVRLQTGASRPDKPARE